MALLAGDHQAQQGAAVASDDQHGPVLAPAGIVLVHHPRPDDLAGIGSAVRLGAYTSLRARCAVGRLLLVTGRPATVVSDGGGAAAAMTFAVIRTACCNSRRTVWEFWTCRASRGAPLNTRFSANRWNVFHCDFRADAIFAA